MNKKWNNIRELIGYIAEDSTLDNIPKNIKFERLCYAPGIGARSWIFDYKGTLVSLWDLGNGHYSFDSAVTIWDLLRAKLDLEE